MAKGKKMTQKEFEQRVKDVWGDSYSLEKAVYININTPVCLICKKHGEFTKTPHYLLNLHTGCNECAHEHLKSLVCGVGINDLKESTFDDDGKRLKSYFAWCSMMSRCYSEQKTKKYPTYNECSVCEEWKRFSNFKKWFDNNYVEGYSLDKDILVKGNKMYSPETCCFVPEEINSLITNRRLHRSKTGVIGVHKRGNKFRAVIGRSSGPQYLGTFNTINEAFLAYKKEKEKRIKIMVDYFFDKNMITQKVYDALINYKVEITD